MRASCDGEYDTKLADARKDFITIHPPSAAKVLDVMGLRIVT
jgi:hypothetical protein